MNRENKINQGQIQLDDRNNYQPLYRKNGKMAFNIKPAATKTDIQGTSLVLL